MILLVARRRVIIMITTEADKRQTFNMSVRSMRISLNHFIYLLSCTNVKLSLLFVALYLVFYAQY